MVDIWKKNDNPLLPLPHSHLPRKYFSTFWPLLLIFASESVIMEPQLTHLETYICVGHLTLLTYFLPFLCYRNLLHLKEWSLYFLMKDRQQRDFVLSVTNAFRVSGTSGVCLGKKWDASHLDFLLSPYRPTWLWMRGSVFPIHPQMRSTLKTEGAVNIFINRNSCGLSNNFWIETIYSAPMPPLCYKQIM